MYVAVKGREKAIAAAHERLDLLSSDYAPVSLMHAAFLLNSVLDLPLPGAMAKVTLNPAQVLGLGDRGEIAPGKRADMVHVQLKDGLPVARQVWRAGDRVV